MRVRVCSLCTVAGTHDSAVAAAEQRSFDASDWCTVACAERCAHVGSVACADAVADCGAECESERVADCGADAVTEPISFDGAVSCAHSRSDDAGCLAAVWFLLWPAILQQMFVLVGCVMCKSCVTVRCRRMHRVVHPRSSRLR